MKRAAVVLLACAIVARSARAQEARPPQDLREARWYGWQVMLADAASAGLVYAGVKNGSVALSTLGIGAVVTLPPLIHLAHGSRRDAGLSFAFRVAPIAVTVGLYAVTAANHDCTGEYVIACELYAFGVGAALEGVAVVADWIFLSTERSGPRLSLAPVVPMGQRRGQGLALALRF